MKKMEMLRSAAESARHETSIAVILWKGTAVGGDSHRSATIAKWFCRLVSVAAVIQCCAAANAQVSDGKPPIERGGEDSTVPAFGPGSPTYGQPFFHAPGASQRSAGPELALPQVPQPAQGMGNLSFPRPEELPLESMQPASNYDFSGLDLPTTRAAKASNSAADGTWVFNFQSAPWSTVLKNFARFSKMPLILEQRPGGEFTYFDENAYEFSEALDVLNDHLLREGFLLVRNENKLTAISANSNFRDGTVPFVPIASIPTLGRNELVSVALPLRGAASEQIVTEVQQLLTPLGRVLPLSNSNRLIVTDTGASLRRLRDLLNGSGVAASGVEHLVIHLRNTKANEIARAVNQRLGYSSAASGMGSVVSASATSGGGGGFSSSGDSQSAGRVGVVPEPVSNSLLIEGTPEELGRIEALVRELDRDPGQVMIQALLVEVLLGNSREQGVELGFQDSVLFDRSVIDNVVTIAETFTSANGVQTTNQNIISQTAAPGFPFNGAQLGNNVTVNPSAVGKQSVTNLGLGRVSGDLGFGGLVLSAGSNSVNVLIRALAEKHKLEVLSRPHIRAVNNHEALIQIGQQVPVVDGVTISANGSANPVVRQDKAGIILKVIPRISDDGRVQIDVQAEKSAYQLVPGSGVPIFTDATTGAVIEAPVKDITTAQTTVTAVSGQTIVLGGMITREESTVERKVPILGDIPLLGRMFRVDLKYRQRKELLIFLTPTIIRDDFDSNRVAEDETRRMHVDSCPNVDLHRDFMRPLEAQQEAPFGLIQ